MSSKSVRARPLTVRRRQPDPVPSSAGNGRGLSRSDLWPELADAVAGLGEGRSPEAVLAGALARLRQATGAERAVVWLDVAGQVRAGIVDPPLTTVAPLAQLPAESDACAAIRYAGDVLGVVEVAGPALRPGTSKLVRDVATAAAGIGHTIVVREAVRHHVVMASNQRDQLDKSRSDLVARQNAERRRVASDLHDGCQQRVTVIAGKIGLIRTLLGRLGAGDAAEAARLRAELDGDIEGLVEALAAITSGQVPPQLGRNGLAAAIRREVSGSPLRVEVTGDPGPLPSDVEETVYFCCLEAVQNAARHSGGQSVRVSLQRQGAALLFTVSDDGVGFDAERVSRGSGLRTFGAGSSATTAGSSSPQPTVGPASPAGCRWRGARDDPRRDDPPRGDPGRDGTGVAVRPVAPGRLQSEVIPAVLALRDALPSVEAIHSGRSHGMDLDDAARRSREVADLIRGIAHDVLPPVLADCGLAAALRAHVRRLGADVTLTAPESRRLPESTETTLYACGRLLVDAIGAESGPVALTLTVTPGDVQLAAKAPRVADDGRTEVCSSNDASDPSREEARRLIADRLAVLGGDLTATVSERLTEIRCRVPLSAEPITIGAAARNRPASRSGVPAEGSHLGADRVGVVGAPRA